MPYGRDFGVGGVSSLISPVFGSSRPTRLAFCAVNHRIPLWSKISVWGSRTSGSGIPYSLTAPVLGSSLPIKPAWLPVYQMWPSRSSTRPWGPEWGVLSGYSLNRPVFGSSRPSTLVIWPVYQSAPSAVASGSCGRDPPLLDRDPRRPRNHHAGRLCLLGEVLGQVRRHGGKLIRRNRHAEIDHHPHHGAPSRGRVSSADARGERVATIALGGDPFLARAIGQLLAPGRKRRAEQSGCRQGET